MALIDRLLASDGTKLPIHQVLAYIREVRLGKITRNTVVTALGLTTEDITELQALFDRMTSIIPPLTAQLTAQEIIDVLMIAERQHRFPNAIYKTAVDVRVRFGL